MHFRLVLAMGLLMAPAFGADSFQYTATTVGAISRQGAVSASGIRWQCDANGCTTTGPWAVPGVAACKSLAQQIGPIRSYGHPKRQLSKEELAVCNKGVVSNATLAQASPVAASAKPGAISGPAVGRPALNPAQLRQGIKLRSDNYDALARARKKAMAEAERQRVAANTYAGDDCNDARRDIHPGAAEICDGYDNNCDGIVDERQTIRRYLDADGDGHGDPAHGMDVCPDDITNYARSAETTGSPWLVEIGNDCNDQNPDVWRDCH